MLLKCSPQNHILLMSGRHQFFILSTLDITSLKYFPLRWVKNGISLGVKFPFFMNMSDCEWNCIFSHGVLFWEMAIHLVLFLIELSFFMYFEYWNLVLYIVNIFSPLVHFSLLYITDALNLNINSFAVVTCISHYIMLSIVLIIKRPSLSCNYKAFLSIFFSKIFNYFLSQALK